VPATLSVFFQDIRDALVGGGERFRFWQFGKCFYCVQPLDDVIERVWVLCNDGFNFVRCKTAFAQQTAQAIKHEGDDIRGRILEVGVAGEQLCGIR